MKISSSSRTGAVAVAACLAFWTAPSLAAGNLIASDRSFDFGKVRQGENISHCFPLSNTGTKALRMTGMSFTYPGMKGRGTGLMAPASAGQLCLDLDTSSLNLDVDARALVTFDDPDAQQLAFDLRGFVSKPIDLMPMAVFADIYAGEGAERHIKIVNNEPKALAIRKIEKQGTHFDATVTTVEDGRVFDFVARIDPSVPPGRYGEFAYLVTNDQNWPRIRIGINILVKQEIYALPQALDFGKVSLAQLRASPMAANGEVETLIVRKREGSFRLTKISSDIPGLIITATPK